MHNQSNESVTIRQLEGRVTARIFVVGHSSSPESAVASVLSLPVALASCLSVPLYCVLCYLVCLPSYPVSAPLSSVFGPGGLTSPPSVSLSSAVSASLFAVFGGRYCFIAGLSGLTPVRLRLWTGLSL